MKLKTTDIEGKTYAIVQDGNPVYVHDDGKEAPFDASGTVATIRARNAEAKANRPRRRKPRSKRLKVSTMPRPHARRWPPSPSSIKRN